MAGGIATTSTPWRHCSVWSNVAGTVREDVSGCRRNNEMQLPIPHAQTTLAIFFSARVNHRADVPERQGALPAGADPADHRPRRRGRGQPVPGPGAPGDPTPRGQLPGGPRLDILEDLV